MSCLFPLQLTILVLDDAMSDGHWCNTCQNFKAHYVHFAQRVQAIAATQNVTVGIYAISCYPNRRLCRNQKAQGYPLIRLLGPGQTEGIDMKHTEINPVKCLTKMGMHLEMKEEEEEWDLKTPMGQSTSEMSVLQRALVFLQGKVIDTYHHRTREELKQDIHLSFDFAMRDGVFSSNEALEEAPSAALKDWLRLLYKVIPISWEMHALLNELIKDFNYVTKHEDYLYSILDQYPPPSSTWSVACSHGDPDAGYTCGLWELFHAMTVGFVNYNTDANENRRIAPAVAANALRNYVDHFFGCAECRLNFLTMYDSCAYNRCNRLVDKASGVAKDRVHSWAELPLYLFEVHNGVNVRLMKEKAAREGRETTLEDEIGVLWPSRRDCRACWKSDSKKGKVEWDATNVYKWLQLEYGQRNSESSKVRKELKELSIAAEKKEKRKKRTIKVTNGSLAMIGCVGLLLGAKIQRRRITGRHKKEDDSPVEVERPKTSRRRQARLR
jgi:thiol oxidase